MARWDNLADEDRLVLKEHQLPAADRLTLERAFGARPRPRSRAEGGRLPSKATIRTLMQAYCRWAGHLKKVGRLTPDQEPADRATAENLDSFFEDLSAAGLRGQTINFYFGRLRRALERMYPGRKFREITHPDGIPLRRRLDMACQDINPPTLEELIELAMDCFQRGLVEKSTARRLSLVQDAAIQAVLCGTPPRRRALGEMRAGIHLRKLEDGWWLMLEPSNTKKARVERHRLDSWTWPIFDRFHTVERPELMAGGTCDALWLKRDGKPLTERGVVARLQWRTNIRFGKGFGPHTYRYAVAIAEARNPSAGPLSPSIKLGHADLNSTLTYLRELSLDGVAKRQAITLEELRELTAHLAKPGFHDRR